LEAVSRTRQNFQKISALHIANKQSEHTAKAMAGMGQTPWNLLLDVKLLEFMDVKRKRNMAE
jgi:hypothetical protein